MCYDEEILAALLPPNVDPSCMNTYSRVKDTPVYTTNILWLMVCYLCTQILFQARRKLEGPYIKVLTINGANMNCDKYKNTTILTCDMTVARPRRLSGTAVSWDAHRC